MNDLKKKQDEQGIGPKVRRQSPHAVSYHEFYILGAFQFLVHICYRKK